MKESIAALIGAVAFLMPIASQASAKTAVVVVKNKSDWELHHFFLSAEDTDQWGPDQLGEQVIGTGEIFTLKNIPCDTYDVKLVDEDGDECVVSDVDICGDKEGWVVTSKALLSCQDSSK